MIAQYPMGGVTWDYVQYAVGLRRLGHDVFYLEDTGQWPYDPHSMVLSDDGEWAARRLRHAMSYFDLDHRWMYRFPRGPRWFGLDAERRREVIETADILINVSGVLADPSAYRSVGRLAFVDTDPVFTQIKLARGNHAFRRQVAGHDVHFTFGESVAAGTSEVPETGFSWLPTRQPVLLNAWDTSEEPVPARFTTVMNWTSYKPVTYLQRSYGQKDIEFDRFIDLPSHADATFEVALSPGKTRRSPLRRLQRHGWKIVDPNDVCADPPMYRSYLQRSAAEWSVAKQAYVVGRSGWFSCRSACYLAAGRPVVVQDTGFSQHLPTGCGLLAFTTMGDALDAIRDVLTAYEAHSAAAKRIAGEYFDSDRVLSALVEATR